MRDRASPRETAPIDERQQYLIRYARGFAPDVIRRAEGAWLETVDGAPHPRLHLRPDLLDARAQPSADRRRHPRRARQRGPPELLDAVGARAGAGRAARRAVSGAARPRRSCSTPARRPRVRAQAGQDAHRPLRGRRPDAELPRPARRHRLGQLLVRAAASARCCRAPRDPGAVRLPLPDPPLQRDLRLHLPRRRLRAARPAVRRRAGALSPSRPLRRRDHRAAGRLAAAARGALRRSATCC